MRPTTTVRRAGGLAGVGVAVLTMALVMGATTAAADERAPDPGLIEIVLPPGSPDLRIDLVLSTDQPGATSGLLVRGVSIRRDS